MAFSDSLEPYSGNIENSLLESSLIHLQELCGDDYKLLAWSDGFVAVPVTIAVDLPTRGNKNNLDIRAKEPVLFVFSLTDYPHRAPFVYTNRTDFPKDNIAHLYIAVNGRPPAICYTRGKMADWYAQKRIQDLVIRIGNWFQDAATGRINEDGDQFDPLRMEKYSGTIVFDYDTAVKEITALPAGNDYALAVFEYREEKKKKSAAEIFTLENVVSTVMIDAAVKEVKTEFLKSRKDSSKRLLLFGGIFTSVDQKVCDDFEIDFPKNVGELKQYAETFGISADSLASFLSTAPQIGESLPVVLAVKRPKQLIGFSGDYEFLSFNVVFGDKSNEEDQPVDDSTLVKLMAHSQPLTKAGAKKIAGDNLGEIMLFMVYGCGALGSKVVEHLSRSGLPPVLLIDPDNLSPHNLVRHSLDAKSVGLNKASELAKKMRELFTPEKVTVVGTSSLSDELVDKFSNLWLLDFTASTSFLNERVIKPIFKQQFIRTALSDAGNVSYLLKEGTAGNPRVDDLEVSLYYLSVKDRRISSWLRREQAAAAGNGFLRIGVGCNSETTMLPDDTISLHGALLSRILKREMASGPGEGKIYYQNFDQRALNLRSSVWEIGAFDVFKAGNDDKWNIRFASGIIEYMREAMMRAKGVETGGIFIGCANYKTMTIHVLDVMHTPDNSATAVHFSRGTDGLPEQISVIDGRSAGLIGYVGEWHTHPVGPEHWSSIDEAEMQRFKTEHRKMITPLPVFMTVMTKKNIYPYVL